MFELRHLRYFDAVATARSFSKAADALGVSQPPLSRQIQELELDLGVRLFDRSNRPIELTAAGRLLHDQCARILASIEQLRGSVRHMREGSRGLFTVGVVGSIMQGAMPAVVRSFRRRMPDLEIELIELTTIEQVAALKDGRIDAGLGRVRIDDPMVRREVLIEERLVAALSAAHPLALSRSVTLDQLQHERLILYPAQPRPSYADQLLALFRDAGCPPLAIREVREIQTALGLVASEAGIAVVPLSMSDAARSDIAYRPISDKHAISPVLLSQRLSDNRMSAQVFLEIARREVASAESSRVEARREQGLETLGGI